MSDYAKYYIRESPVEYPFWIDVLLVDGAQYFIHIRKGLGCQRSDYGANFLVRYCSSYARSGNSAGY